MTARNVLRGVGMSRAQIRSSVRWESAIIALFGTALAPLRLSDLPRGERCRRGSLARHGGGRAERRLGVRRHVAERDVRAIDADHVEEQSPQLGCPPS
jgi:hypothetical protein